MTHADDSDDFAYQIAQREFQAEKLYWRFASVRNGFPRPRSTHNGRLPQKYFAPNPRVRNHQLSNKQSAATFARHSAFLRSMASPHA